MRHHSLRSLLLLATLLMGCSSGVRVNVLEPARVNVGPAKRLVLVQAEGQSTVQSSIARELELQTRQIGYFAFTDQTYAGARVNVSGEKVELQGDQAVALKPGEIGLRIDVLGWDADLQRGQLVAMDANGKIGARRPSRRELYAATLILGVTAFNAEGKVLAQDEYSGRFETARAGFLLRTATEQLVDRMLQDLTPRHVSHFLKLDDGDEAQRAIIQVAEQGELEQAIRQFKGYTEQHPDNAAGWYNLAVLLDASGDYRQAMHHYSRAISLTSKDSYAEMRDACVRRQAMRLAMRE
ncbi:tetratricopeptide repeat protein [Pyxidicoccus parkwayensis]|uniref:Tetratricopeptide repeat protein n=1 Tax=Pyxidicoccus parkwayensis TaxID=2813578 RepID=A0ABX7NZF9_9BACT|nr:tetratricopeptide repeat protein [Pyxidicoccus parkwaysis]QSQ22840.1 tetratricopeptide repeat protein [Pyxidicoccus parkwaysis]